MSNKLQKTSYAKTATFQHEEHADRLDDLNTQAQNARRVDVALGLYCFELKEVHLQSGQFGKWLAEHKPHLARQNEKGSWEACRSLETAMYFAKSALDVCGYKIGDYIALLQKQIPRARGISINDGQLMLLPAEKLPEEFAKLQQDIFAQVDGKSKRQLISQFKQVDENNIPKRGRLKGEGGASREQRAAHKLKVHELDLKERRAFFTNLFEALDHGANQKGIGDPELADVFEMGFPIVENFFRFMQSVKQARKGN